MTPLPCPYSAECSTAAILLVSFTFLIFYVKKSLLLSQLEHVNCLASKMIYFKQTLDEFGPLIRVLWQRATKELSR